MVGNAPNTRITSAFGGACLHETQPSPIFLAICDHVVGPSYGVGYSRRTGLRAGPPRIVLITFSGREADTRRRERRAGAHMVAGAGRAFARCRRAHLSHVARAPARR